MGLQAGDAGAVVRALSPRGAASPDAVGTDLFQTRGDFPGAGGELGIYPRAGEALRGRCERVESVCLHGRGLVGGEGGRCGRDARGFGKTGDHVGAGEHGGFRNGRDSLGGGGCVEVRAARGAPQEAVSGYHPRPAGLRARGEWREVGAGGALERVIDVVWPVAGPIREFSGAESLFDGVVGTVSPERGAAVGGAVQRGTVRGALFHGHVREIITAGGVLPLVAGLTVPGR